MTRSRVAGWTLHAPPAHAALMAALVRSADAGAHRLAIPERCSRVLRDDARSFVGVLALEGREVVAKSPREADRRAWIRLTTLWRPGFARRALAFLERARAAGLPVAEPWGALELRRAGMVRASWLFHEHIPGRACTLEDLPLVVASLRDLHAAGWSHGDAHIANFLATGAGVSLIDTDPRRRPWGRISEAYDYVRLRKSLIDTGLLAPEEAARLDWPLAPASIAFRLAAGYERGERLWRAIKQALRGGVS